MIAILSDIHGNLEALNSVLNDITINQYNIDTYIILGDIIDYGADNCKVIDKLLVLNNIISIRGNHDDAVINNDCSAFNTDHGRKNFQITCNEITDEYRDKLIKLCKSDTIIINERVTGVHATIYDPMWGKSDHVTVVNNKYSLILPDDMKVVLQGHSHIQGYYIRNRVCYINPGSVGQPRNGDPRSQYIVCDNNFTNFTFKRIEYNIKSAADKIVNSGRPSFLATRLFLGI